MLDPYDKDFARLFFSAYGQEWVDCFDDYLHQEKDNQQAVEATVLLLSKSSPMVLVDPFAPWAKPEEGGIDW